MNLASPPTTLEPTADTPISSDSDLTGLVVVQVTLRLRPEVFDWLEESRGLYRSRNQAVGRLVQEAYERSEEKGRKP